MNACNSWTEPDLETMCMSNKVSVLRLYSLKRIKKYNVNDGKCPNCNPTPCLSNEYHETSVTFRTYFMNFFT